MADEAQGSAQPQPREGDDESQFRLAIEASPTGMLMVDRQGKIVLVNAQVEKLFGYHRRELIGRPIEILVPERFRTRHPGFRDGFYGALQARPMGAGRDLYGLRKDGSEVPIEIGLNPLQTARGTFVLSSVVDITERTRAERSLRQKTQELERSNRELEQFAAVASHDLREPLRMVATYVTLLQRDYGDRLAPEANEYIQFAVDGAQRMARLVSDLLAYARVGPQAPPFSVVDCSSAFEEVQTALRQTIDEVHARVSVGPLPLILGDYTQVCQVFQNLLENALKFRSERPPRIALHAECQGNEWLFCLSDNGIGIEPRFYTRVFDLFQRLHGPDRYPGTGMGLALCKKIVERHGGRIWVESQFGEGTRFFLTLINAATAPEAV